MVLSLLSLSLSLGVTAWVPNPLLLWYTGQAGTGRSFNGQKKHEDWQK